MNSYINGCFRTEINNQLVLDFAVKAYDVDNNEELLWCKSKPFKESYSILSDRQTKPMSAGESFSVRNYLGADHIVSRQGIYLREGLLSDKTPGKNLIWLKKSIITLSEKNINDAVNSNANSSEYYPEKINNHLVEDYLSSLIEGTDYYVVTDFSSVNVEKISFDSRLHWLLGDDLENSEKFLRDKTTVRQINIHNSPASGSTIIKPDMRFATQMYISSIPQHSGNTLFIGGISGRLNKKSDLFGLREQSLIKYNKYSL